MVISRPDCLDDKEKKKINKNLTFGYDSDSVPTLKNADDILEFTYTFSC